MIITNTTRMADTRPVRTDDASSKKSGTLRPDLTPEDGYSSSGAQGGEPWKATLSVAKPSRAGALMGATAGAALGIALGLTSGTTGTIAAVISAPLLGVAGAGVGASLGFKAAVSAAKGDAAGELIGGVMGGALGLGTGAVAGGVGAGVLLASGSGGIVRAVLIGTALGTAGAMAGNSFQAKL